MRIAIASDETSNVARGQLRLTLIAGGHSVLEGGPSLRKSRTAIYAEQVGRAVLMGDAECGIIISSRALEACAAANKVSLIRAGICYDAHSAEVRVTREGMNVLIVASESLEDQDIQEIVAAYLIRRFAPIEASDNLFLHRWRQVFSHIQMNIMSDLSVTELAKVSSLSPSHFSRLFKKSTGTTAHRYVLQQRVQRAQKYLLENTLPLDEVASRVGFRYQSHFTSVFSRLVGISPKRYRDRSRLT